MNAVVDATGPQLAAVETNPVPEGARVGTFMTEDKVRLRYGLWPKTQGPMRGTVCLLQGRTEFIEKYFETIADFQRRGFAVATFDWRGQGGSERLINSRLGYVDRFDDYWLDLKSFHGEILLPDCPPPFYLVAHSMGGLVALNAAIRDRLMFDRMLLSAPMVGLDNLPLSARGVARIGDILSFLGLGRLPISRRGDRLPSETRFPGNPLTSDLTRYMRSVAVLNARPDLAVGAPTVRWLAAATRALTIPATTTTRRISVSPLRRGTTIASGSGPTADATIASLSASTACVAAAPCGRPTSVASARMKPSPTIAAGSLVDSAT